MATAMYSRKLALSTTAGSEMPPPAMEVMALNMPGSQKQTNESVTTCGEGERGGRGVSGRAKRGAEAQAHLEARGAAVLAPEVLRLAQQRRHVGVL